MVNHRHRLATKSGETPIHAGDSTKNSEGRAHNRAVPKNELIAKIKNKKELATLDDDYVQQKIEKIFSGNNKLKKKFEESKNIEQFSRSKEYEEILKRIRKELRAVYGVFSEGEKKKNELLEKIKKEKNTERKEELVNQLLQNHKSTQERIPYYDEIYTQICKRTNPKVIIDLGCGLNPLAYNYLKCKPKIIASDVSKKDMEFLDEAFKVLGIPGKTVALDLTKDYEKLKSLKGDVTFLLKLLDSLEESHRHISYKIFDNIKTPWIIASFPTKSLGGKKNIASAGRTWFERLLKRKNLTYETFSVDNELFYVINTEKLRSS